MKKFLFTLLTLFMASSAFAEGGNYLTMNDYTVVKTKLETKQVSVGVKAHFDNYVSAMQVWVEVPEGVTLRGASAGNDYGISYMDNMGMDKVATPEITFKDGKFVIASMAAAYGDDGDTFYGVAKWAPGDYANYLNFVFRCNADFKGGDVKIIAAPACGDDTRPEVVANRADGTSYTTTSALSVEYIAPEPVLTWDENNYSMTATLPEGYNADDYEIVMMANGVEVQNTYTVDQTSEDQTIEFTAYTKHAADETYDSNDATYGKETKQTVTVPAKVVETIEKPVITFSGEETTEMTVTVSCATEGVTLYVNGEAVEGNPYSYIATRADVYTAGTVEVTAVAKKGELESEVASDSKAWVVQQKPEAPKATKTEVVSDTEVTVNFTPAEGTAVSVAVDGQTVQLPYVIERPAYGEQPKTVTFTVTVTGDNYTTNTYEVTVTAEPQTTPPTPVETKTFVKVTKADQLVVGKKYIIVCGNKAMGAAADGNFLAAVAITAGDEVEVGNDVAIMTLDGSLGHYTLAIDGKYLSAANSTGLSIGTSATEWAISDYNGTLAGYRVKHADYNRAVRYSSSYNRFGNYSTTDDNSEYAWIYVEKVELQDLAGEIVVSQPDENGVVTVTYTPGEGDPENYTVTVNGEPLAESYQLEDGVPMEFNVVVSAEGYNDLTAKETRTWNKPVPKEFAGTITVSEPDENGVVTVTYTPGEGDPENYTVTVNGEPLAESYQLEDGVPMEFNVVVSAEGYNDLTAKETRTWTKPTPKELTGEITFSVTQGNKNNEAAGIVTATYNGPETGVTVKIVGDPSKVAAATSEGVRLPDYGTYKVMAVATAEGYADLDGEGEVTWDEPQTDAPEFNVSEDGLTVEATGEGTVTLYVVDADGNATAIDNPTTFDQKDEAYEVTLKAVAHVDGAKDGVATKTITIPAKSTEPGTGVNELVDGKAVKSVRYFNMAGQEMQEVNGVTIVVTTYTDGTTSAVKVMK